MAENVGYLWVALGVFQLGYAIFTDTSLSGKGFWLLVGLICVAWSRFSKIIYTVYQADKGAVFVIQDKNHDRIIRELRTRRKSQLLKWYGEVNPDNDLKKEIEKFKWLEEEGIITKEESNTKIAQAEFAHKENFSLPGERPN